MEKLLTFQDELNDYRKHFHRAAAQYDQTMTHHLELQQLIDEYSRFVINPSNHVIWEQLQEERNEELSLIADDLRQISARCVAVMEKYRALKLLDGSSGITDYFRNIESCIEQEFGRFQVTSASRVLMIGSGSFPMTPLLIARRTGAEVVGIDIDEESVQLGRAIVDQLGQGLNIRLLSNPVEELEFTGTATHIIFSSTVAQKYDILDRLYPLTGKEVIVAMRYGDGLKSLFNFPSQETDSRKWQQASKILRPDQVFDIALYRKESIR
ncbi:SAM-dependent methyltransferase [Paenibacillus sp. Z6-24]